MASATRQLADERQEHYKRCKQLLGVRSGHDYHFRTLWLEALKEAADLVNYLNAMGSFSLADKAAALGDEIISTHSAKELDN